MKDVSLPEDGQAAAEMLLAFPVLFLLATGIFQFSQLFLARIRFEQACNRTVREWSAGVRDPGTIRDGVWASLGGAQAWFRRETLQVRSEPSRSALAAFKAGGPGLPSSLAGIAGKAFIDYEGVRWVFSIRCRRSPLFSRWMREEIRFTSGLAALRHPARTNGAP